VGQIWDNILNVFEGTLRFLHDLVASVGFLEAAAWGWAIVLLTLIVRVLLLPLAIKQTRSMRAMQALQPQLKELQNAPRCSWAKSFRRPRTVPATTSENQWIPRYIVETATLIARNPETGTHRGYCFRERIARKNVVIASEIQVTTSLAERLGKFVDRGGGLQGQDFRLDIEGEDISDEGHFVVLVHRVRLRGHHVAEAATAGADVPQDHEGGGLLVPALADIGAAGALAYRVQMLLAHELFEFDIIVAVRQLHFKPGIMALR
jgi:hypothetical protein